MNLIKILTPKDTEEIKPGLFIQKTKFGYRHITPVAWDGKINWKNFLMGKEFIRSLIWFIILMLIASSYYIDTKNCQEFQSDPCKYLMNLSTYCMNQGGDDDEQYPTSLQDNSKQVNREQFKWGD